MEMAQAQVDILQRALESAGLPAQSFTPKRTYAKAKTPRVNLFKDPLLLPVGNGRTWIKVTAYNNGASIDLARYESCPDNDPANSEDHWAERQYGFAINEAELLDLLNNADQIKARIALAKETVAQEGVNKKEHMSNLVKQSAQARAANFEAVRQRYLLAATAQGQPAAKRLATPFSTQLVGTAPSASNRYYENGA